MLRSILLKTLRDQRRALVWWGIGLTAFSLYIMLVYPSMASSAVSWQDMLEDMPPAIKALYGDTTDLASPEGFVNAEIYYLMGPILFLIFTIAHGSGAIAGEEERGTLDLLLANPLPRWRVVVEKWAAMVGATSLLAFVLWSALALGATVADVSISLRGLAEATLSVLLLGLVFGTLALTFGCARGNRGLSIALASAVGIATYLVNTYAPLVGFLETIRWLSPFRYYIDADPLRNGLDLDHAAVLVGISLVELALAVVLFARRDLAA